MLDDGYACADGADALVIVTEWEQFRALDLARLKAVMARPIIVDLRNIYPPPRWRSTDSSIARLDGQRQSDWNRRQTFVRAQLAGCNERSHAMARHGALSIAPGAPSGSGPTGATLAAE
jgi:hypothetical protein